MKKKYVNTANQGIKFGNKEVKQDFIENISKFLHKYSPDKKSKKPVTWDPEEIEEYIIMALDEMSGFEDFIYAILYQTSASACTIAGVTLINTDEIMAKKFIKKSEYWRNRFNKTIRRL